MPASYPAALTTVADVSARFDQDGADQNVIIGRVTRPGLVNSVEFIPGWTLSGANTNSRTYSVYNRGPSGAGTALVAQLALTAGVNLTKAVAKVITLGAAADRVVAVGDVLQFESLHVGSGLPDVGGLVIVQQSFTP